MNQKTKKHIVVVGGGFGGVKAALELSSDDRFEVTLISSETELRYYPTLYHTATGGRRANSSIPLSFIFQGKQINIIKDTAKSLDRRNKILTCTSGKIFTYDDIILSLGVITNYFGIPGLSAYSFSIKSQDEAERFKKHLHAQIMSDHKPDLDYIIVGAGPTGIELAGALPIYLKKILKNHNLPIRKIHVDLMEAAPKLLPRMPKDTSRIVKRRLKNLGVNVMTSSNVQGQDADNLLVNGKPIRSHTVIWTAGVTNHPFFQDNGFSMLGRGKVAVDVYLRADENVYVLGDNANTPYSGMAQTALHDGKFVATNLKRLLDNKDPLGYKVKKPISIIPAGPNWAAVNWGKLKIYGRMGWLLRESADYIGFKDLENWYSAAKQLMTEYGEEDKCQICATAPKS